MVAVFNDHSRTDQSSPSSNGRNGQNAEGFHFLVTTVVDALSTTSPMNISLAEVRRMLSTALGSASESPDIIEEV